MIREGHEEVSFFYGIEIERTPAYGKKTLFVVGVQPEDDIAQHINGCEHIYFGANMSFPNPNVNDANTWDQWQDMITPFMRAGYLCSLDIDVRCVEGLLECGLTEYHNFIPMISVKIPYLQQLGYNATVKIDDKNFNATNPGVWCHSLYSLTNPANFTSWREYTKDSVL
jgi:hypothetical protein